MRYAAEEPFGFPTADIQHARMMHLVGAVAGVKRLKPEDWLLVRRDKPVEPVDPVSELKLLLGVRAPEPAAK